MRNFGMPLALASLTAAVAFWFLLVSADLVSTRLHIGSPRAAVFAVIAAVAIGGRSLHVAADRLAVLRLLLPCATMVIVGVVVYRGLTHLGLGKMSAPAVALVPWLLGIAVVLSMCAYWRTIGPIGFTVLLPIALLAAAPIVWRYGASPWFVALPWAAALMTPLLDWTPPVPTVREWTAAFAARAGPDGPRPDVLLVTVDALRADALPLYGGKAAATPTLDRLAADSYVFEQACSPAPWTLPAMASLFTGADTSVHGVTGLLTAIPRALVTLPEALRRSGYHTAAFGAGNGLLAEAEREFWRGFDTFEFVSAPLPSTMWASPLVPRLLPLSYSDKLSATDFTPRVAARLARPRGSTFTWVHLFDTHSPYRSHGSGPRREFGRLEDVTSGLFVPSPAEKRDIRGLYDGEVEEVDRGLGTLLDGLRRSGMYDETLIVFVADHGEEFWDHGSIGHGRSLYRDQIHVPLVIKLPGGTRGIRVPGPVSTANVAATIVDVVGLPGTVAGQSLSAAWGGAPALPTTPVVSGMASSLEDPRRAVTFGSWVYIRSAANGREELYDLAKDPGELDSHAATQAVELQRGRTLLAAADHEAQRARIALGLAPPATREVDPILRSMGYIK
jgi:arylsulfatase A-like enzyme